LNRRLRLRQEVQSFLPIGAPMMNVSNPLTKN
jgi:hypothetical protein